MGQTERFVGTIAWFFLRVARAQPRRHAALVAAAGGGIAALSAGFGAVVAVLAALESGTSFTVAGFAIDPAARGGLVVIAAVAAAAVMVGASLVYGARRLAVDISAEFQRRVALEVAAARGPLTSEPVAYSSDARLTNWLTRLATGDARRCALALRRGLEVPVPLLIVTGGSVALFLLDAAAAAASVVLAATVVPVMYLVNLQGVRASKRYESLVTPARTVTAALLDARRGSDASGPDDAAALRVTLAHDDTVAPAIDAFRDRVIAALRADLASQLVTAAATFGLLVYLGLGVLDGRGSIVALATFMVVLRLVLGALRNVFVGIATISRHYPFLYAYRLFLRGLEPDRSTPATTPRAPAPRRSPEARHEPRAQLRGIAPGALVSISATVAPGRYAWGYLGLVLAGGDADAARWWRDRVVPATRDGRLPAGHDPATSVVVIDGEELGGTPAPRLPGVRLGVVWLSAKPPDQLASDLHLVTGPDGRAVGWGSVAWVREHWGELLALRRQAVERFDGAHGGSEAEDDDA